MKVLFDIFLRKLSEQDKKHPAAGVTMDHGDLAKAAADHGGGLLMEVVAVSREFAWLAGGGLVIGLAFGILTT